MLCFVTHLPAQNTFATLNILIPFETAVTFVGYRDKFTERLYHT